MMVSAAIVTGVLQLPPIIVFGLAGAASLAVIARIYFSVRATAAPQPIEHGTSPAHIPAAS
jgi:hypothetical protein